MSFWFIISLLGIFLLTPVHFLSVEHKKLDAKYGEEKGKKIGTYLGFLSGWGYFLFLFGIWLSPQEKFTLPLFDESLLTFDPIIISLGDLLLGLIFLIPGIYLGIKGVTDIGLAVAETHRAEEVVSRGLYSQVRHPQYLGAWFSHLGITFLLSAFFSLLVTPIIILRDFIVCRKEERELIREFGSAYEEYMQNVPMLIPRIRTTTEEVAAPE